MLDLTTLEGGTRRARRSHEPVLVPKDHLAIGPHVDHHGDLVALVHPAGEDVRGYVPAHEPCPGGSHEYVRLGEDAQFRLYRPQSREPAEGGNVGLQAYVAGCDAEEEVLHHGVARDARRDHLVTGHATLGHELVDYLPQGAEYGLAQLLEAALVIVHVGDPGDDVLAEGYLGVLTGRRGDVGPVKEVDELAHDRGGPYVDGDPELAIGGVAGL